MKRKNPHRHAGVILLVVLSMLTFFSLLIVAYLVFSSRSQHAAFAIATRNIKQPDPNEILNEAIMTLIRGTDNKMHPFFGEDLLSDYYGRTDFLELEVRAGVTPPPASVPTPIVTPLIGGFVRMAIQRDGGAQLSPFLPDQFDDRYSGRIITFTTGALQNRSFRVLRSFWNPLGPAPAGYHDLVFELPAQIQNGTGVAVGDKFLMNGVPRNAKGMGFNGTEINASAPMQTAPMVGDALPAALQPNHLGNQVDKSTILTPDGSDFDECYDAPDFLNWFLSHRHDDGTVIPSFHRPAVINYILNQVNDWPSLNQPATSPPEPEHENIMANLARGTLRPLPIAAGQFGSGSPARNRLFTGGSEHFALRMPILVNHSSRLDQIAKVLTGSVVNPYDVDNDSDGVTDSIWVDLGLPIFTSPEGKLLKPLIAPMIEDLSGKLDVNAHSNYALIGLGAGLTGIGSDLAGSPPLPFLFRGQGFGPAEIAIPAPTSNDLARLLSSRYRPALRPPNVNTPGATGSDALDVLTSDWRPATFGVNTAYADSVDPYGRKGRGLTTMGHVASFNFGTSLTDNPTTSVTEPNSDEVVDDPYEFDPTGRLGADRPFTADEFEAILRRNEFDTELLPDRLRSLLEPYLAANADFAHAVTTFTRSDDSPVAFDSFSATIDSSSPSAYAAMVNSIRLINPLITDTQLKQLIAPELRLGHKMDVNRRFGNGYDDNANGIIDEPIEYFLDNFDDDGDGDDTNTEADETSTETLAFRSSGSTIDPIFASEPPHYDFDETPANSPVSARELFARHLYVLMMLISHNLDATYPAYGDTLLPPPPARVFDRSRYRARRLAQWAVNVVDYRDPDSIMTRFVFDDNPLDGWDTSAPDPWEIVWGCESPELLFTESLALHDVRVKDTDFDTPPGKKGTSGTDTDDATDQVRVPQGSLFLELYNPRRRVVATTSDPATSGIPRELYAVNTIGANVSYRLGLDFTVSTRWNEGATTMPDDDQYAGDPTTFSSHQVPVWRIAISEPHDEAIPPITPVSASASGVGNSPISMRDLLPDSLSFQPELNGNDVLDELSDTPSDLQLDRFIFFTSYGTVAQLQNAIKPIPDINDEQARVYFNFSGSSAAVPPEGYLCLAPRTKTHLGSFKNASGFSAGPSEQAFEIRTTTPQIGLIQDDSSGDASPFYAAGRIQAGNALEIASFPPPAATGWAAILPNGVGLNVSEPLASSYYPTPPPTPLAYTPSHPIGDAYVKIDPANGNLINGMPLLDPADMSVNGPIRELTDAFAPGAKDPMLGSIKNYRTAFLQRLADPTRGFHPRLNPYRTVDQIAIDLTIFSGEETSANVLSQGFGSPAPAPTYEADYCTASRQRDGIGMDGFGSNILFSYSTDDPATTPSTASATEYFWVNGELSTTFNFLNRGFGIPEIAPNQGRPPTPFAMQPWLNRPFASPYELMMVPACSAGRLFEEFSVVPLATDPLVFPKGSATATTDADYLDPFVAPYRHLLNFFHSQRASGTLQTPEFATLFELVGVAPPFRGELTAMNPARVAGSPLAPLMSAPFNFLDNGQRVGRVNLNTLSQFPVWAGLMQGHMNPDEFNLASTTSQLAFNSFIESRRGYVSPGTLSTVRTANPTTPVNYVPAHFDPRYPTQFAGVFKRNLDGPQAPLLRNSVSTTADDSDDLRRRRINATLMRGAGTIEDLDPDVTPSTPTSTVFFVRDSIELPLEDYQNRQRNPLMRYQTLMRMPNLVSDNSQVFLVRLTMGFFEVDPTDTSSLGAEYNETIGQNQRHRAMFIIDRSIPVGFDPGKDLNARETIIFERFYQ